MDIWEKLDNMKILERMEFLKNRCLTCFEVDCKCEKVADIELRKKAVKLFNEIGKDDKDLKEFLKKAGDKESVKAYMEAILYAYKIKKLVKGG